MAFVISYIVFMAVSILTSILSWVPLAAIISVIMWFSLAWMSHTAAMSQSSFCPCQTLLWPLSFLDSIHNDVHLVLHPFSVGNCSFSIGYYVFNWPVFPIWQLSDISYLIISCQVSSNPVFHISIQSYF
jgi:hypothetical protein